MKRNKGYTIIETMIAVSVFLVIVTAGMSALLNATAAHQKSQDFRSIIDNLSFIMEDISRNIRTGYNYDCSATVSETPLSCALGGTIFFEPATGFSGSTADQWGYKIISTDGGVTFNISRTTDGGANWIQLNPPEVVLKSFSGFSVLGAEPPSDTQEPFVIIKLVGSITYKNVITPFSLQTSVSQRLIDN